MDADDDKLHQNSSSLIKQQSTPKLVIKLQGRKMVHPQQQQQQCKEAEEEVMKKKKMKIMSVSKHHNLLSISNTTSTNSISNNSDSSLSPTTCSICGVSFPSKNSLFGHMKHHPDREWRGIRPPPPSPLDQSQTLSVSLFMKKYNSPASTNSDDSRKSVESYQGVGPLPVNWSNTGKRGRIPPSYDLLISSDDEKIAAQGLLMLKEGNDLDVASMNKQISRETEGISMKKRKKKRMILESSSSEEVSRSSDLLRSSKKIKIDQERSCGSSRAGFGSKLVSGNIQSSQLEQLPPAAAAASNMFQEDCGLVKNVSKKVVKLGDERISCGSSRDVLMNSIPEQLPQVDFSLLKNHSKKLNLDDESGCSSSMFDQGRHLQQMFSNGYGFDSKLLNSIHSSNHHLEQMSTPNLEYFQGGFNSVFPKPDILMKAKKKVKENEKGSSAANQNMGMQAASCIHKCDTCNRTFPSHQALGGHKSSQRNCKSSSNGSSITYPFDHHQYLQCGETMLAVGHFYITETKMPTTSHTGGTHRCEPKMPTTTTSHTGGTHRCEKCGDCFLKGQALGGHKRAHYQGGQKRALYKGGLNTSGTVHVNSTTMAQTDQLMTVVAQTEKLIKKEEMNRLSVVPVASSSVGEEVISTTTTTTVTKTENKPPVLDFDLNEIDLNETPDDHQSWK